MRRNIGSAMTRSSANQAVRATSSGAGQRIGVKTTGSSKGSMAGLKNNKSAYVQHRSGGYNNPGNQTARYSKSDILAAVNRNTSTMFQGRSKPSILDNRLTASKESSISILSRRLG